MSCTVCSVSYRMMIPLDDVLTGLLVLVAVMLVVVLYHVLFIVVDLRKVMKRVEGVSGQVEELIMKPLTMTDKILEWALEYIESLDHSKKKRHHDHKKAIDA